MLFKIEVASVEAFLHLIGDFNLFKNFLKYRCKG